LDIHAHINLSIQHNEYHYLLNIIGGTEFHTRRENSNLLVSLVPANHRGMSSDCDRWKGQKALNMGMGQCGMTAASTGYTRKVIGARC
jgi:hypothetical protein